jgi:hypothetical protein
MEKILLGLISLLVPGAGFLLSGKVAVGIVWLGIFLLIYTSPIIAIASALHYVSDT